jgi:hypothetical protein
MAVLKLHLLIDLQQKVGELALSITSCPSVIILENVLHQCIEKCGYGNFNQWYNVCTIHLHALWVWEVLRRWSMCAPTA